ncbi:methylmalonyl-CoA mutase subunit beta [Pontibacter akesuensis]|uniref:Heterodimeric methylmalonyl-CoA mutase small subunit n=1 Tax=Pontibacter akesuensis TaxID=388950 RepID=A0A1I7J9V0_9BACT|nr:methylmalonyl-CoA mutase subunit beta [Pontibacter akesuensis]GHA71568.1 methylmalonyl-CoA mutase small subunit [Pontibacter akesuensis]SFU81903.1 heterodimeric methylmalonyl-CoA mutase small subunit [Pontibacter akesuensis]
MTTDEQQNQERLFADFTPATAADWEQKARKDLRETPLESLNWHTYEGIDIKPYYAKEDIADLPFVKQKPGDFPFMRGNKNGDNSWLNVQQIQVTDDGRQAIDKAADALQRGADGIHFVVLQPDAFNVAYLVEKVDLGQHSVSYTLQSQPNAFLKRLYAELEQRQVSHRNLKGFVNFDPMTAKGGLTKEERSEITTLLDLTKDSPELYGVCVNGTSFSSIGASMTQEIAYTLSAAVAYADRLTTAGEPLESVLRNMQFCMASGTNYFFEIAKLRALRLLWSAVVEAYQAEPALAANLRIHSATSSWYQTTLDPYVNMLRTTTEAMSAVIAGCDSLTVSPFDSTFKASDEFSERIARNVSIILKEEAYLDKALDPAAGSYYLESLTNTLAQKAWELFKEVESLGGFEDAYDSGFILGSITEVSREKFRNLATGRDILVGTNKYPNPNETLPADPEALIQSVAFDTTRAAYPTEVMRMATELHLRKRKRRPRAVVATIGNGEQRLVNATFAQEFFSCAGFETEQHQFASVEEASDQLTNAAAEVVVVSASEAAYVNEFGPRLRNHHAKPTIILADNPQHMKEEMMANGYDEFIFDGCDMSTILEAVQKRLAQDEGND